MSRRSPLEGLNVYYLACSLVTLLVVSSHAFTYEPITIKPDKENIVATRLEGVWRVEPKLTARLTGRADGVDEKAEVTFKSDPEVLSTLPLKFHKLFKDNRLYLAGYINIKSKEAKKHKFVLIQRHGNNCIVLFRDKNGEKDADIEMMNVMIAPAADKNHDLLFTGGDFNGDAAVSHERIPQSK